MKIVKTTYVLQIQIFLAIACAYVERFPKNTFICLLDGTYKICDIAQALAYRRCRALIGFTGSDGKFNGFGKQ